MVPGARDVLTDIFKSCVHSEQMLSLTPTKPLKVSDIHLSKEQISSQTPGNLLHVFFNHIRPPKKVFEDQLTQVSTYVFLHVFKKSYPRSYCFQLILSHKCVLLKNLQTIFLSIDSSQIWHSQGQQVQVQQIRQGAATE